MMPLDPRQAAAREWFELLRDRICAEFEAIERESGSDAAFDYLPWNRDDDVEAKGGGGVRGVLKGRVFEKVGVNVSTVGGEFSPEFVGTLGKGTSENRKLPTVCEEWFWNRSDPLTKD